MELATQMIYLSIHWIYFKKQKYEAEAEIRALKEMVNILTKQVSETYSMAIPFVRTAWEFGFGIGNKLGGVAKRGHLPEKQEDKEVKNAGESQQDSNDSCFPGDSYVLTEQNEMVFIADVVPRIFSFVNSNGKMESNEVYTQGR